MILFHNSPTKATLLLKLVMYHILCQGKKKGYLEVNETIRKEIPHGTRSEEFATGVQDYQGNEFNR
jgi:hypothetical protein